MAYRCHRPESLAVVLKQIWPLAFENESWIEDEELKEVMKKYVSQGLRREEILDYLERDFSSVRLELSNA